MKYTLLFLLVALSTAGTVRAQTQKGTLALGLNAGPDIRDVSAISVSQRSLRLMPTVGYFLRDNVLIGIGLPLRQSDTRFIGPLWGDLSSNKGQSIGVSLFMRRYLSQTRFKPFIHAEANYNTGTSRLRYRSSLPDLTRSGKAVGLNAGLGGAYFFTDKFSVEATATLGINSLDFAIQESKLSPSNRYLLIGVGANWYLGRKPKP